MPSFDLMDSAQNGAVIKVIGVGGGGGNAIAHMVTTGIDGVDFICADTDNQNLQARNTLTTIRLDQTVTGGLGAGMRPEKGRDAAEGVAEIIAENIKGANMLFIAAGMGGGTGTGAAPVVARIAKELGILTVAVVTKPFGFEAGNRAKLADQGREELLKHVDSMITIPNDKLPQVLGDDFPMLDAFSAANDILQNAVQGIAELITRPGLINVDFADVSTVMSEAGTAMMGSGVSATPGQRAREAAEQAINSPLLDDIDLTGSRGILVNVTSGPSITMGEFTEVGNIVRGIAADDANVIIGMVSSPDMGDDLRVTVVATGIGAPAVQATPPPVERDANHSFFNSRPTAAPGGQAPSQAQPNVGRAAPTLGGNGHPASSQGGEYGQPAAADQPVAPVLRPVRKLPIATGSEALDYESEYFDAPAFLRHQND